MRKLALVGFFLASAAFGDLAGTGLETSISVDTLGRIALDKTTNNPSAIDIRGAEVMFYAPADHMFDGALSFAFHGFENNPHVELHEAYFGSTKLIPKTRFRIGQYFLGIGRLNQFHQHDWAFITAPKYHRTFFAQEGLLDTGIEASVLLPLPFFLELTGGLTKGWIFGHDHSRGAPPQFPTNYLRLATYVSLPGEGGAQIGLNYVGRRGNEGIARFFLGADVTAKWRDASGLLFLFQGEFWYRELTPAGAATETAYGFYLYPELGLGGGLSLGVRFDYFTIANQTDALGDPVKNVDLGFVPTLSYRPSEFTIFRLAYNHLPQQVGTLAANTEHALELQGIFILGSHPAHDF